MFYTNMLSLDKEGQISAANIHLINDAGLEVYKDRPGHVFSSSGLGEESVEAVVRHTQWGVARHQTVGMNAMFQAVQLPATFSCLTWNGRKYQKVSEFWIKLDM